MRADRHGVRGVPHAGAILTRPRRCTVGRDEIDRAASAAGADKARGPFRHGKIGAVACGLFTGIDVDAVPAVPAPGVQQQIGPGRAAERRRPRGTYETLTPALHMATIVVRVGRCTEGSGCARFQASFSG